MPTKTDNGIKSVPPTVSNPDTLPSSVEASPSSALRGTAEPTDGNAVATVPTPWSVHSTSEGRTTQGDAYCIIQTNRGYALDLIACPELVGKIDDVARLIVRAVNAHEALVNELTLLVEHVEIVRGAYRLTLGDESVTDDLLAGARAALALAEGSRP